MKQSNAITLTGPKALPAEVVNGWAYRSTGTILPLAEMPMGTRIVAYVEYHNPTGLKALDGPYNMLARTPEGQHYYVYGKQAPYLPQDGLPVEGLEPSDDN